MKTSLFMLLHSMFWAAALLLLAWWLKHNDTQSSWLFCAVALWCCSHSLLQYGFCRRRLEGVDASNQSAQCKLLHK